MLDTIVQKLLALAHVDVATLVGFVVAFNVFLSGINALLSVFKDKTASQVDNKIYDFINKVCSWLIKIIDLLGGNVAHKD